MNTQALPPPSPLLSRERAQLRNLESGDEAEESQETSRGAEVGLVGGAGVGRAGGRASGAGASAGRSTTTVRGRRGAVGGRVRGASRWLWQRDRGGLSSRGGGLRDDRSAGAGRMSATCSRK